MFVSVGGGGGGGGWRACTCVSTCVCCFFGSARVVCVCVWYYGICVCNPVCLSVGSVLGCASECM